MHVLVTGHTGFKGSWLSLLLAHRGHEVSGLALDPVAGGLFELAGVASFLQHDVRADVRDAAAVQNAVRASQPNVVIHMAAQPLVRESLRDSRTTVETNVMGTLNVLDAVQHTSSVRAHVVVTTDKVYRNHEMGTPFAEDDPLGGHDPYSASKAMAELLVESWSRSFAPCPTATARAGNVIGGGDVSQERLLPDLLAAFARGDRPVVRYPGAVRPWQHVLDAVDGYLVLVDALLSGTAVHHSWNFGPDPASFRTVGEVADRVADLWGDGAGWDRDSSANPPEAGHLTLDSTRAARELGWSPRLDLDAALTSTVDWARQVSAGADAREITLSQVAEFDESGQSNGSERT